MNAELPWKVGKEYKTVNRLAVRIYDINAGGLYPIHGAFLDVTWHQASWSKTGITNFASFTSDTAYNLVLPPKPKLKGKVWVLVSDGWSSFCCSSEKEANDIRSTYPENNYTILCVSYDVIAGSTNECRMLTNGEMQNTK